MLGEREWFELPEVASVLVDITGLDDLTEVTRQVRKYFTIKGGLIFDMDPSGREWVSYTGCEPKVVVE